MLTPHLFVDKAEPPREPTLHEALGGAAERWEGMVARLQAMGARGTWAWGGTRYGWEMRFRRAGRPFTTLTPRVGVFVALVILGREDAARAEQLTLGDYVRHAIRTTPQLRDGRWLFLSVATPRELDDVLALLTLKLPPRERRRLAIAG
jgi:hypothetical protein